MITLTRRASSRPEGPRVGIVGAGLMGRWHAHAARRAHGRVVGVADVDLAAGTALAGRHGAESFGSLDELLAAAAPDVLHVCTPLETHEALTEAAIGAGVHVLVEKPLAERAEGVERLYARAAERGLLLAPVHQYAFQDSVNRTARRLARLGPLVHLGAVFCSAGAGEPSSVGTLADRVVAEILPHPLSLVQAYLPGALEQGEWSVWHPGPGELRAATCVGTTSLALLISMAARPPRAGLWLAGARAGVELDLFHDFALWERGGRSRLQKMARPLDLGARLLVTAAANLGRRAVVGAPAYPGLNTLVARFYDALRRGAPSPIPAEAALAVARAQERILGAAGLQTILDSPPGPRRAGPATHGRLQTVISPSPMVAAKDCRAR